MGIFTHGKKIFPFLRVNYKRTISPLEYVAYMFIPTVESSGIRTLKPTHTINKIGFRCLHQHMIMIIHQYIRMDYPTSTLTSLTQYFQERIRKDTSYFVSRYLLL